MPQIFRQTPLYKFMHYCSIQEGLDKNILDCGAGGDQPPLALFESFGYVPHGVEISDSQIVAAQQFGKALGADLNIVRGDMRALPYQSKSMSFVYSYNSIFHMTKKDIAKAVCEIKRVLKPGGLCFINFLSHENDGYGAGEKVGDGEFLQDEGDEKMLHSYHTQEETDTLFQDMQVLLKETRVLQRIFEGSMIKQGFIDYIAKKPMS